MDDEIKNNILKTGTTILGIVCKDGVVMAGDRQVTAGASVVVSKNYPKVVKINDYLVGSWTGGVADAQRLAKLIAAELKLKELRSKERPTVREAASLAGNITYSQIRAPSMVPSIVGMLVAGYNEKGEAELYSVEPAGSVMRIEDYDANFSSGMPYVLGLLERGYKKNMPLKEGIELAREALKASTQRDAGSGYGIDIFTISKEGIQKVVEEKILPTFKSQKE